MKYVVVVNSVKEYETKGGQFPSEKVFTVIDSKIFNTREEAEQYISSTYSDNHDFLIKITEVSTNLER